MKNHFNFLKLLAANQLSIGRTHAGVIYRSCTVLKNTYEVEFQDYKAKAKNNY